MAALHKFGSRSGGWEVLATGAAATVLPPVLAVQLIFGPGTLAVGHLPSVLSAFHGMGA